MSWRYLDHLDECFQTMSGKMFTTRYKPYKFFYKKIYYMVYKSKCFSQDSWQRGFS
ncbi:hypothetical protein Hanom_Chr03g00213131 [Helianthus anomalus]